VDKKQQEEIFLCRISAKLIERGFAVAIPRPDILGEDLWFSPTQSESAPGLYLAQLKSRWQPDPKSKRQFTCNIAMKWFTRALHNPRFLYILGLRYEHDDGRPEIFEGYVPASIFRGGRFLIAGKHGTETVPIRIDVRPNEPRKFQMYTGAKKNTECFVVENADRYFNDDGLNRSLAACLENQDDRMNCELTERTLEKPIKGRKAGTTYSKIQECPHCGTTFLRPDGGDVDVLIRLLVERGMSQQDFIENCPLDKRTIRGILEGKVRMTTRHARKLAQFMDVNPEQFVVT